MPRSTPEWIGKTDDSVPPARVKLRVLRAYEHRCHITNKRIRAADEWDLDHIKPLRDGGENRETNLAPALRLAHRAKTAAEAKDRKRVDNSAKRYAGIKTRKGRPMPGGRDSNIKIKMNGDVVYRDTGEPL